MPFPALAIPFAVRNFLSRWWPAILFIVVILGALSYAYFSGRSSGKAGEVTKQLERENEVQRDLNEAGENASVQRVEDTQLEAVQQKEIEDAVRNSKGPDDLRARRGCVILRQQGRDTSRIPACQ